MNLDPLQSRNPAEIGQMFSSIAHRYDLMNTLMTAGADRGWRKEVVRKCTTPREGNVLDLGTGTGELALNLARNAEHSRVWASDISFEMIAAGKRKPGTQAIRFSQADALRLPFPDGAFDTVVSAFLMRNLPDQRLAIEEQIRVLKPGGRLVFLDILSPHMTPLGMIYRLYFFRFVPWLGRLVTGSRTAYRYLPSSTVTYPSPFAMLQIMKDLGLVSNSFATYMGNTISIHIGNRPS